MGLAGAFARRRRLERRPSSGRPRARSSPERQEAAAAARCRTRPFPSPSSRSGRTWQLQTRKGGIVGGGAAREGPNRGAARPPRRCGSFRRPWPPRSLTRAAGRAARAPPAGGPSAAIFASPSRRSPAAPAGRRGRPRNSSSPRPVAEVRVRVADPDQVLRVRFRCISGLPLLQRLPPIALRSAFFAPVMWLLASANAGVAMHTAMAMGTTANARMAWPPRHQALGRRIRA